MRGTLTPKRKKVYEYIKKTIEKYDIAPTLREIADHFGIAAESTIHEHLTRLERDGWIKRDRNGVRGIYILQSPKCPVCHH